ncbi:MAG: response regulator transcription factor [Planctomycetota bacterium]
MPIAEIKVLLTDDHALVRDSLAQRLEIEDDIAVVGSASTADEAVEFCSRSTPDVVVMDIEMPGRQCFDAWRTISARLPGARLIFLSAHTNDRDIAEALKIGAAGYLTKDEPPTRLIEAIRRAARGESSYSESVRARIVARSTSGGSQHVARGATLSPRETEVLRYIARGLSKKEIASVMCISVKTVDNHSTSLMSKLDVHDRVELARYAIREGLVQA